MSKKRAVTYSLKYVHPSRPYVTIDFLDKKGKTLMSSVDVVLNSSYFATEEGEWDTEALFGYVRTR